MSRKPIFDAIRTARGYKAFTNNEVVAIDAFLDQLGIPGAEQGDDPGLAKAVESIKRWEGCRLTAYPDPGSGGVPWTIGYGSTRDEQGRAIVPGTTWTQDRAEARLAAEVAEFAKGVDKLIGAAPTTPGQRAALISITYNIGLGALKESTLLRLHKEGDHAGAEGQFARWNKADGKVMQGLSNRRAAEAAIYGGRA
jgi:lysozyme